MWSPEGGRGSSNIRCKRRVRVSLWCFFVYGAPSTIVISWLVLWNHGFFWFSILIGIPTDFHIFQRGRYTTSQYHIIMLYLHKPQLTKLQVNLAVHGASPCSKKNMRLAMWVCLKIVYPYTQWFCWSLSLLNGYFIGGIPHFQTYPYNHWLMMVIPL